MFCKRFAFTFVGLLASCWSAALADCQLRGVEPAQVEAGYRQRGNRCEGLFRQPVAASARVAIIGFHRHEPAYAPGSVAPIVVKANLRGTGSGAQLRVLSSRQRMYYRMDAPIDASGQFIWDPAIINNSQVRLLPHEIKAIGCLGTCDIAEPRLVPVSIAATPLPPQMGQTIWLRAAVDLKQLFVAINRSTDGKSELNVDALANKRPLPAGAAEAISLKLKPGQYKIKVTAIPNGNNAIDEYRASLEIQ